MSKFIMSGAALLLIGSQATALPTITVHSSTLHQEYAYTYATLDGNTVSERGVKTSNFLEQSEGQSRFGVNRQVARFDSEFSANSPGPRSDWINDGSALTLSLNTSRYGSSFSTESYDSDYSVGHWSGASYDIETQELEPVHLRSFVQTEWDFTVGDEDVRFTWNIREQTIFSTIDLVLTDMTLSTSFDLVGDVFMLQSGHRYSLSTFVSDGHLDDESADLGFGFDAELLAGAVSVSAPMGASLLFGGLGLLALRRRRRS